MGGREDKYFSSKKKNYIKDEIEYEVLPGFTNREGG